MKGIRTGAELHPDQRQALMLYINFPSSLKVASNFTLIFLTSTTVTGLLL